MKKLCLFFLLICLPAFAYAHKSSDSYLSIMTNDTGYSARWDIALRDLDFVLNFDRNRDGNITWGEVRSQSQIIRTYALAHLQISSQDKLCLQHAFASLKIDSHTDGNYAVLTFSGDCPTSLSNQINIAYNLFNGVDSQHRGLLNLVSANASQSAVLIPGNNTRSFYLGKQNNTSAQFSDFVSEGIWHIWLGFDHILFLLSLLLPSVLVYQARTWQPARTFQPTLWDVTKIVTAFTLAHSLTLSASALGYVELPSNWVEASIAVSVIIAALNNLFVVAQSKRAQLAFGFGLIHGFGFASVLADLGLNSSAKLVSLLGFNLGVEIGQLVIVAAFLPLAYALRNFNFYEKVALKAGSVLIVIVALNWLIERTANI